MATHQFPSSEVENYNNFLQIDILESPNGQQGDRINLFMPAQPKETVAAEYDQSDSRLARGIRRFSGEDKAKALELISSGDAKALKELAKAGIDATSNTMADIVADNEIARAISAQTVKLAGDPSLTYLFKTMAHRTFSFSFNMIATNQSDTDSIRSIVKSLKRAASPEYVDGDESGLIRYPDTIKVKYKDDKYLHKFQESVIQTVDVTYNTLATDKYTTFENGAPLGVQLDLTFQEMKIVTKNFFDEE